ncbi:MAG: hypothetical protein ACE5GX_01935 [Thermoanaerobaculia bacterium]
MGNGSRGGRRKRTTTPTTGTPASTRTPSLSPSDPRIASILRESVRADMAREAAPVRTWLDANADSVRGFAMPALIARIRRAVPEAREMPNVQLESIIRQWANERGLSIPRLSIVALPGVAEVPPASGPSFGDSDLADAVRRVLSIPTSIEVARPHGRAEISVSGATVELRDGGARAGGSISWGGTLGVFTEVSGVRFSGSLSAERWSMTLSFPSGPRVPNLSQLGEIFREGESSFRTIAGEARRFVSLGDASAVGDAISPHLAPVKRAISAARGIAAAGERRVSFDVSAGGPSVSPGGADPGFQLNATLTIRF